MTRRVEEIRKAAVSLASRRGPIRASDIVLALRGRVSRQYVTRTLRQLVSEGVLIRAGSTRGAAYALAEDVGTIRPVARRRLHRKGLQEDEVLADLKRAAPFIERLSPAAKEIFTYAFTEMLNNAIEHSRSRMIEVTVWRDDGSAHFMINDFGIGVFRNVMRKRSLASELEAIQDLLKGKTTTASRAHSGEGIFFTSKLADEFILESFNQRLRVDNTINDVFIEKPRRRKRGTRVLFRIVANTRRRMEEIFQNYAAEPAEPAFDRSEVRVRLFAAGQYLSRSQARRLLVGLDKFRVISLDFKGVDTIGQAFADEIFRVFRQHHPQIVIRGINMNDIVTFMVDRASRPSA